MAAANWVYFFQKDCAIQAGVEGGRLYVATAVQDPGTGIRSVLAEAVAGAFGVEAALVQARIGDTWLARGPISSASRTTATLLPAALAAAAGLRQQLAELLAKRRGLVNPQVRGVPRATRGQASCTYRTTIAAKGLTLRGAVSFTARGERYVRRFATRLR